MLGLQSPDLAEVLIAIIAAMGTWMAAAGGAKAIKDRTAPAPVAPSGAGVVEIAGAVINDKKANEIIAALERHGEQLDANTRACNSMGHRLDPLAEVVRDLAKEYEIASRLQRTR